MDTENTTPFNRRWASKSEGVLITEGNREDNSFTLASYNILSDAPIRANKNYRYVPDENRYMTNRHPRIMQEIRTLNPDIICFQEVQEVHFKEKLQLDMGEMGYQGHLFRRHDDCSPATFYKKDRFRVIGQHYRAFIDILSEDIEKLMILPELKEATRARMNYPHNIGLVKLKCLKSDKELIIGNVHFKWGELKQPASLVLQACAAVRELLQFDTSSYGACVLCGDFNTSPGSPPYKMLVDGKLDDEALMQCRQEERLDVDGDQQLDLIDVTESYWKIMKHNFKSAYNEIMGKEPDITNADDGDGYVFVDCLDYIWYNPEYLMACGVLQTPTRAAILQHVALPSVTFPSDHICIIAKLDFK